MNRVWLVAVALVVSSACTSPTAPALTDAQLVLSIYDHQTERPISGATVSIAATIGHTDTAGQVRLATVANTVITVEMQADGYAARREPLRLTQPVTTTAFTLIPLPPDIRQHTQMSHIE